MSVRNPAPFLQYLENDSEKHRYVKTTHRAAYIYLMINGGGLAAVLRRIMDLFFRIKRSRAGRELGTALRLGQCSGCKI